MPAVPAGKAIVPDLSGQSLRQGVQTMTESGLVLNAEGTGVAVSQSIAPNTIVDRDTEVTVKFKPE